METYTPSPAELERTKKLWRELARHAMQHPPAIAINGLSTALLYTCLEAGESPDVQAEILQSALTQLNQKRDELLRQAASTKH